MTNITDLNEYRRKSVNDTSNETPAILIQGAEAAILYSALSVALIVTREQAKLKSAATYKGAIALQIASYEAEQTRIASAFPQLRK